MFAVLGNSENTRKFIPNAPVDGQLTLEAISAAALINLAMRFQGKEAAMEVAKGIPAKTREQITLNLA
ncbi:MAG: hypothetical protein V1690_00445 [Candidatus Moraniibacteriota bacterium]